MSDLRVSLAQARRTVEAARKQRTEDRDLWEALVREIRRDLTEANNLGLEIIRDEDHVNLACSIISLSVRQREIWCILQTDRFALLGPIRTDREKVW